MDEPPSLDLLVKFAAEKERQAQLSVSENLAAQVKSSTNSVKSTNATLQSKTKKKMNNPSPILPPMKGNNDEQRLLELERLAVSTAQIKSFVQQQQLQQFSLDNIYDERFGNSRNTQNNLVPISAPATASYAISGTEADFLMRQIHSADSTQLTTLSKIAFDSLPNNDNNTITTKSSIENSKSNHHYSPSKVNLSDRMQDAIADKVVGLEKQVEILKKTIERKEAELIAKDEKIKKITNDFEKTRKGMEIELNQLESMVITIS
jgi:hypothetical protein